MVHIRWNGTSRDVEERVLGLRLGMSDDDIREAVARYLDADPEAVARLVVVRTAHGDLLLRPEAVFG